MASSAPPSVVDRAGRLWSIDALRGFDMFWIIGGEELIKQIWIRFDLPYKGELADQLEHVEWQGFHFEDLIFPLFLFLVGVVLPFSLGKVTEPGAPRRAAYWRILRRTLLLYVLGLVYYGKNGFFSHLDPSEQRYMGVLQRIAICYGIAAFVTLWTRVPGQIAILFAILVGYWAILTKIPVPGTDAGPFTPEGNLCGYLDRLLLPGKTWVHYPDGTNFYDNEGLLSNIPAVATALLGVLAGHWLRSGYSALEKTIGLVVAGAVCLAAGMGWSVYAPEAFRFPVIKLLWTSTYVLIAGGWSLLFLALFYFVIDGLEWRSWAFFFVVIGANAITIYVAHDLINFSYTVDFLFRGLARWSEAHGRCGDLVNAAGMMAVQWLLLYALYRNRVFLRV